jgi:rsbT co-antagonist protein RsbR
MTVQTGDLAALVVKHLVEIVGGGCSITEEEIRALAAEDQPAAEILSGLLYLHQDLVYRENERLRAEAEAHALVDRLSAQNRELDTSREKLAALAAELSTPVIRVWEGVIMLPVVGGVDEARGAEITERLLTAVVAEKASVAIIDITGVLTIDTGSADQFVRMIRSIELLGAKAILAGARPSLALAITGLGVELAGITTVRNVQQALLVAMGRDVASPRRTA